MKEKLLWTKVIPDSGENLRIGIEGWDKVNEIVDSAEIFLNNSDPLLYANDYDYFRYTIDQYRYNANFRFNLIEASKSFTEAFEIQNKNSSFARTKLLMLWNILATPKNVL